MVKRSLLFNKLKRFKKGSCVKGQFFSDQHLLKNQLSFEDITHEENAEQEIANQLGEAKQEIAKQKSKKKKITSILFFALNIVVVAVILIQQLSQGEVEPFSNIIASGLFKWQYIPLIAVVFAATVLLDSYRSYKLMRQATKQKRFALNYKMIAVGRYWDCITPMSTGGEPSQVFYLHKNGVDAGTALFIPVARYVIFQISWIIVSLFATIYASKVYGEADLVSIVSYIGFGINFILMVGIWFLSVSKKLGKILVAKTLKLLQKMRIIKNYEKQYEKVMKTVSNFQSAMTVYTKNLKEFIWFIFLQVLQLCLNFFMPYLIYLTLGGTPDATMAVTIGVYTILIDLASGITPLPGGTGMSEVSFTIVFADIFPNGTVFWGLLFWRIMSYYVYIAQGLLVTSYDYIWGNKKYEWQKRKWELEAESNKFKLAQIRGYNKRSRSRKIKI
ncbi:MAG: flippase-like domain-containing protein [Clostridia bacterium]|nr:flippase-like domain-containing protein [Clostridia bacterium]